MLGTCQHLKRRTKTPPVPGLPLSLPPRGPGMVQPCPGAGSDTERGALIRIYQPLCPQLQSRGLTQGLQESGCDSRVMQLWGGGSPCSALPQELPSPGGRISSIPCSVLGNLSGYILWWMKHEDVLVHSVILRGLAWLMICPLIFHGVCVCVFSLSLSQSH